jgi:telomerase reverse transcriptase
MLAVLSISVFVIFVSWYPCPIEDFLELTVISDVLNRFPLAPKTDTPPDAPSEPPAKDAVDADTTRVMMYIFPRQFGLHNVFTSVVDRKQTAQKFQDYTLREEEISAKFTKTIGNEKTLRVFIPKRLKGKPIHLVERLQILHGRCAYSKLLQHYCPAQEQVEAFRNSQPSSSKTHGKGAKLRRKAKHQPSTQPELQYETLVDLASPVAHVSAFCRAALAKIVPDEFWGTGAIQEHNKTSFHRKVDTFIRLRRFENLSLQDVMQGLKVTTHRDTLQVPSC